MSRLVSIALESGVLIDEVDFRNFCSLDTVHARTGGYCITGGTSEYWGYYLPNGVTTEIFGGISFYFEASDSRGPLVTLKDDTGNTLATITINNPQSITISSNGTSATTPKAYGAYQQHYCEFHYKYALLGTLSVKIDGGTATTITCDTRPAGSTSATLAVQHGCSGGAFWWDDVVINDTATLVNNSWPGRVKLYPVRPNAAGDVTGQSRGGVDTGDNYKQVNEVPATDTSYVYATVADTYDLYNYTTEALPPGYSIQNLIVCNVSKLDSGGGQITSKIKSDGVEGQGTDHTLSNSDHCYTDAFNVNPATGLAWDQADLDAIQAGPMARA